MKWHVVVQVLKARPPSVMFYLTIMLLVAVPFLFFLTWPNPYIELSLFILTLQACGHIFEWCADWCSMYQDYSVEMPE